MDSARIDIMISGCRESGYELDGAEMYTNYDLRQLIDRMPKALKAAKKELKRRRIARRCRELEHKDHWSLREAIWYALFSKRIYIKEYDDFDIEWYEFQREMAEAD